MVDALTQILTVAAIVVWLVGWAALALWAILAAWDVGDPVLFLLTAPFVVAAGWLWPALAAAVCVLAGPYYVVRVAMRRSGVLQY